MSARPTALLGLVLAILWSALWAAPLAAAPPLIHHDAELRLLPEERRVVLRDRLTVEGRQRLVLRAAEWLMLEDAALDGEALRPRGGGGAWTLKLPSAGRYVVELRFAGRMPAFPPGPEGEPASFAVYGGLLPETPERRMRYRLSVTVPAPYRAVATGRLLEESLGEAESRAVFEADYPAEPPALFVGPYSVRERREDGLRLRTWFHDELAALSEPYLERSAALIRRYAAAIGPYPFRDFHIVSAQAGVGLGFPGLTYVGRRVLPLPFMRGRSLAHEVLHNWWGNGVAADLASGNWVEGLTTYMADYALAAEQGPEAAREMRLGWLRDFAALPPERDQPVTRFVSKRHDASQVVGYGKVAFIFHMLRQEVGEAAFAAALRRLWSERLHASAAWSDIRAVMERASGAELGWFFEQWLTRAGAPRIALGAVTLEPAEGGQRLSVAVTQEAPAYRLSLPVTIETAEGRRVETLVAEGPESRLSLVLPSAPTAVRIDPEHDVFRRLLPGESPPILRDVTLSREARVVVAAADDAAGAAAWALAARLLEAPDEVATDEIGPEPLLLVGTAAEVAEVLSQQGWGPVPESLTGRGTARAWTLRRAGGAPVLAVAAEDAAALEALLRPLPHYGGKSYLVFEGRRALDSGLWRVADSPLSRDLR